MNTPNPESQATKRAKNQADFQTKVMKLVDQEGDELSMTLSAVGKKIKRSLCEDKIDELMGEIQMLVSWFIRSKNNNKCPSTHTPPAQMMNAAGPAPVNYQAMPPLQHMGEMQYDAGSNPNYYNL